MTSLRRLLPSLTIAASGLIALAACEPTVPTLPPPTTAPAPTTPTTVAPAPTTTVAPAPAGWRLIGGDEFDDTTLDGAKWKAYHNTYGDGNKELACLTPQNVVEGGGHLTITSRKATTTCPGNKTRDYTSGFIGSRDVGTYYPKYARFEIRAKLPHAQGLWPAFWLRHRNGASVAEVDILEYFHAMRPGQTASTLHLDGRTNLSQRWANFEASDTVSSGWHTWAVEIDPDPAGVRFVFSVDGKVVHTYVDTQHHWSGSDDAATWDIAVNQAVGGSWTGEPDGTLGYLPNVNRCSIGGTAPSGCVTTGINRVRWNDPADSAYVIDYVRVFTRN